MRVLNVLITNANDRFKYFFLLFLQIRIGVMKMNLIEIKSATITEKGQIAIPSNLRKRGGFKEGSKVAILAFEDHIEIRHMKQIGKKIGTAIASEKVLAKDWNKKEEDEAWKNL